MVEQMVAGGEVGLEAVAAAAAAESTDEATPGEEMGDHRWGESTGLGDEVEHRPESDPSTGPSFRFPSLEAPRLVRWARLKRRTSRDSKLCEID